ncbi:MAG: HAMP domain-containing histidine kinase [Vicinamibacteria bacterium]|nr:HAMP domain-containing histidine kinase [Vicinamibacteria bacterium]
MTCLAPNPTLNVLTRDAARSLPYLPPARRSEPAELVAQQNALATQPSLLRLVDELPVPAAVLNPQRQVVHENASLRELLRPGSVSLLGLRLGEAAGCRRATDRPSGCGTSEHCHLCGLGRSLSDLAQTGETVTGECRIAGQAGDSPVVFDLRARASRMPEPLGERFDLVVLEDISAAKRREALEQMFFHDVLNTLSGLDGYMQFWDELSDDEHRQLAPVIRRLTRQAVDEVVSQRDLSRAEAGELDVHPAPVAVGRLLEEICVAFQHGPFGEGKQVRFTLAAEDGPALSTDPVLLRRVVGNLVKNALEASAEGQTVIVRWAPESRRISVHNETVMPPHVRSQVFQRSFSTKGAGRGVGTHSVRLLTQSLRGTVDFVSAPGLGTTFRVTLPPSLIEAAETGRQQGSGVVPQLEQAL